MFDCVCEIGSNMLALLIEFERIKHEYLIQFPSVAWCKVRGIKSEPKKHLVMAQARIYIFIHIKHRKKKQKIQKNRKHRIDKILEERKQNVGQMTNMQS